MAVFDLNQNIVYPHIQKLYNLEFNYMLKGLKKKIKFKESNRNQHIRFDFI